VLTEALYFSDVLLDEIYSQKGEVGKAKNTQLSNQGLERQHSLQQTPDANQHGSYPVWVDQQSFHS